VRGFLNAVIKKDAETGKGFLENPEWVESQKLFVEPWIQAFVVLEVQDDKEVAVAVKYADSDAACSWGTMVFYLNEDNKLTAWTVECPRQPMSQ